MPTRSKKKSAKKSKEKGSSSKKVKIIAPKNPNRDYYTPEVALDLIYPYIKKYKRIWECCSGAGHIVKYLEERGHEVIATDILMGEQYDVYTYQPDPNSYDLILTSPAFTRKTQFLERMYEIGKPFAVLTSTNVIENAKVRRLFINHGVGILCPLDRIHWIFSDMPEAYSNAFYGSSWFTWQVPKVNILKIV